MASPTRYNMTYDFTGFQSANPNTPLPADKLEIEFINLERTTGETITNLNLIQRSDGKLQNKIVEFEALSDATKALLGTNMHPRGDWQPHTAYYVLDLVTVGHTTYICVEEHASFSSFTVDLQAEKWQLWANPGFVDGTSYFQKFSGDGTTTAFTVSQDMGTDENGLMIFINDSGWKPLDPSTAYTINGTVLTFAVAPPNASNNIFVFAPAKILSQAAAYAVAAGSSAISAFNSASAAATSATNAANSATAAAGSATSASNSASAASTSASNASTSATNAQNSANAAAASAVQAQNIVNSIVPRNVFNKTVDPTVNDDSTEGYSEGSMWVNTVDKTFFVCTDDAEGAAVWSTGGETGGSAAPRMILTGDEITVDDNDTFIGFASNTLQPKTINIGEPAKPQRVIVKDAIGHAATDNITIVGDGVTIDGEADFVLDSNFQAITLTWDGVSNWMVT